MDLLPIKNAILSVSDKARLAALAQGLTGAGVTLYSTGGTRRAIEAAGAAAKDIAEYTGFPEMMDGRLKTLHPKIFGGILSRNDRDDDMAALTQHGIERFELIVVNLYPFEATVAKEGVTLPEAIEQIDIGGPSLIRAAAKNHKFCAVVTDPEQYEEVLTEIREQGGVTLPTRQRLALAAFERTAEYDAAISAYFAKELAAEGSTCCAADGSEDVIPTVCKPTFTRVATLRYGENPHQAAGLFRSQCSGGANLVEAKQLNGKELSYNNLLDLDAALAIARALPDGAVAVIKHNNPCGAASHENLAEAAKRAMAGDPLSAFGSVLGVNQPLDAATAEVLTQPGQFIEAIAAPSFSPQALEILTTRPKWKANVRLMEVGDLSQERPTLQTRWIEGGMLVQQPDFLPDDEREWKVVTEKAPDETTMVELRFGWVICRHVKSNAITLSKDRSLVGCGAGQMSRVDSTEIAIKKAGERAAGSVLASDAFFPFPDSIEAASKAGVAAIIQPGGSKGDEKVIAACNEFGLPMIFTGRRHFKH